MLLLLFQMMCRFRRWWGRNLGSQVFTDKGALRLLNQFPVSDYVDPDIAGMRLGEFDTQLFSWDWHGDDESILAIVTSMVDMTILPIVNAAIASLWDPSPKIRALWGCWEQPNGHGGLYARNVTPIFDNNTAAGWVEVGMNSSNPTLFCVVHCGKHANSKACAQTPKRGGRSCLPLDNIFPTPAEDIIDDIGDELDDDAVMRRPKPCSFPTTQTGFQNFERKLQKCTFRQQQQLEVIWNHALGLFADYWQSFVAVEDVAWLCEHDHIVNPPAAGSWVNRKCTGSRSAAT